MIKSRRLIFSFAGFLLTTLLLSPPQGIAVKSVSDILNEQDEIDVYRIVDPEKSLHTSPQFIVVDDFNSGKFTERQGATWQVKAPAPGALDLSIDKIDARNPKRGYSLRADFNLSAKEKGNSQTFLNLLDVSQAHYFVFKIKIEMNDKKPFSGEAHLQLKDWQHKSAIYDISDQLIGNIGEWTDVILPVRVFKSLDLDALFQLDFLMVARDQTMRGSLWVDEIAFFGFNQAGFESNRDNLVGFPKVAFWESRREGLKEEQNDDFFLRGIARDTWEYFQNARDKKTNLIVDHVRLGDAPLAAAYTSPTNIAMDLLATIGAMDLRFIDKKKAEERTKKVLTTLEDMRKYRGFYYNFYDTKKLEITRQYVSSVDNGWLAISLVVVRQAFSGSIAKRATKILDEFDFELFLDPATFHLFVGFDVPLVDYEDIHYGMLVSEARATSLYAIGKGDITEDHWWFLFRTPPSGWKWQNQVPQGQTKETEKINYFQGYYEHNGKKFVPSWGGSLFEYLMPTIVLKERFYAPKGLGMNNKIAVELHRDYALHEKKYPVWGISPAATTNGKSWQYNEYGVKSLSAKGYPDKKIITPHVSFLALDPLPEAAIENIRKFLDYSMYGEYGLYDTLNLATEKANPQYLALDQGMTFAAIVNYLTGGSLQDRFHADSVGKKVEKLIMKESFFNS